ncbi:MAG: hypothetical protein ABIZ91_09225 [Gemmatimonadaceae bacterium]
MATRTMWRAIDRTTMRGLISLSSPSTFLYGSVTRRIGGRGPAPDSTRRASRSLLTLGAERRITPGATLVAQWASHDPALVMGSSSLADVRMRLGIRLDRAGRPATPVRSAASRGRAALAMTVVAQRGATGAASPVQVTVHGPDARSVEVDGDFTGCQPLPCSPAPPAFGPGTSRPPAGSSACACA